MLRLTLQILHSENKTERSIVRLLAEEQAEQLSELQASRQAQLERQRAAMLLQGILRGPAFRRLTRKFEEEQRRIKAAVILIQSAAQSRHARVLLLGKQRHRAATLLQSRVRLWLRRVRIKAKKLRRRMQEGLQRLLQGRPDAQ